MQRGGRRWRGRGCQPRALGAEPSSRWGSLLVPCCSDSACIPETSLQMLLQPEKAQEKAHWHHSTTNLLSMQQTLFVWSSNLNRQNWWTEMLRFFLPSSPSSEKRWKEGRGHQSCSPALRGPWWKGRRCTYSSCISLAAVSSQLSVRGNTAGWIFLCFAHL